MEQLKSICRNAWCKATFVYRQEDMIPVNPDSKISKNESSKQNLKQTNFVKTKLFF